MSARLFSFPLAMVLTVLAAAAPHAAPVAAASTPDALQSTLNTLARRAKPAQLGIAVLDLAGAKSWGVDADASFVLMSVFKAPVSAAVLAQIDAGRLTFDRSVTLTQADLVEGSAVPSIGDQLAAGRTVFTVRELLVGAVSQSDSTAVDALIKVLGGPQAVGAYLRGHGITGLHVETGEGEIGRVADHLRPGETIPAHETAAQTLRRKKLGYADLLADPRNHGTPAAAADFLRKLAAGELLSPPSTRLLIDLMRRQTIPFRLRGGIPAGADFADKSGTSGTVAGKNAAWNDIAIMTLADGRRYAMAVFLKDTAMPKPQRDVLFADIARAVAASAR
ncbi:class A beta-lactamase [Rugamonas sp.]|uniref:class A beta-lactamase n=1 Tax=Rugamonas sp. TaxID=1926287 RepID=UPI0025CFE94D|nr:class A beta-lactamase [Rugamonas sp.]